MSTSAKSPVSSATRPRRGHFPSHALAKSVRFDDEMMHVGLTDGRIVSVPLIWFPALHEADPAARAEFEIGGGGLSLHWPGLDEDLSVAGLMAGADWRSA